MKKLIKEFWIAYWFREKSSVGWAVFRIAFSIILIIYPAPRFFYIKELYTRSGFLFPHRIFSALHLPVPNYELAIILNIILFASIICFFFGYRTRTAAILIFLLNGYLSLLENFSMRGFGQMIIVYSFLFMFSPAGAFFSVDYAKKRALFLKNTAFSDTQTDSPLVPLTMQRIMLWQLVSIYFFNVISKIQHGGLRWLSGINLFYLYHDTKIYAREFTVPLIELLKPVLPILGNIIIAGLLFMPLGLLSKRDRKYAIAFGVMYHGIALITLKVPLVFSLLIFSLYLIVIEPDTWEKWWHNLQNKVSRERALLFYDANCAICRNFTTWVKAFDFFAKIEPKDINLLPEHIAIGAQTIDKNNFLKEMSLLSPRGRLYGGFYAVRKTFLYIPHAWILLTLFWLPGMSFIGVYIYRLVARNRYGICHSCE